MEEVEGFEPPRDLTPLSVFKTDPFSRTWVYLRIEQIIIYQGTKKKSMPLSKKVTTKSQRVSVDFLSTSSYNKDCRARWGGSGALSLAIRSSKTESLF